MLCTDLSKIVADGLDFTIRNPHSAHSAFAIPHSAIPARHRSDFLGLVYWTLALCLWEVKY